MSCWNRSTSCRSNNGCTRSTTCWNRANTCSNNLNATFSMLSDLSGLYNCRTAETRFPVYVSYPAFLTEVEEDTSNGCGCGCG